MALWLGVITSRRTVLKGRNIILARMRTTVLDPETWLTHWLRFLNASPEKSGSSLVPHCSSQPPGNALFQPLQVDTDTHRQNTQIKKETFKKKVPD